MFVAFLCLCVCLLSLRMMLFWLSSYIYYSPLLLLLVSSTRRVQGEQGCTIVVAMCAPARAAALKMDTKFVFALLVAAHKMHSPFQLGILLSAVTGTSHTHAFTHTYLGGISFRMRC